VQLSDLDFDLPQRLIAQMPSDKRDASRLLVVSRDNGSVTDRRFAEFAGLVRRDDVLVINNTRVFPARLFGELATGARIEIFLLRELEAGLWKTLARPARRLRAGKRLSFGPRLAAEVITKAADGHVVLKLEHVGDLYDILDEIGRTPLPPYIKRDASTIDRDRERYQTVFAKNRGAIAAPTAGLHFTPEILREIKGGGAAIAEITLHVGYGTFEPVRAKDLGGHIVSPEAYVIEAPAAAILNDAKATGRRIIAVGTTTTRALESNFAEFGAFTPGSHSAQLTITPGYTFRAVDALLTNFHLPQSSLLVLTSTFGGHELIMKAYRHAVESEYRFYSYGDCMLIQ